MENLIEQYELIKEYKYIFSNLDDEIIGRIYKVIIGANAKFTWETNYYCRLDNEATVYVPSAPFADSIEEIEIKLKEYVKRFGEAVEIN